MTSIGENPTYFRTFAADRKQVDFGREKGVFPLVLIQVKSAAKQTVFGLKNKRKRLFYRLNRNSFIFKLFGILHRDKYYKELIRSDRYNAVTKEVKEEKKKRIRLAVDELEVIQAREFISLKQLAIYLGVSRRSIYTYMRIYEIPFSQIGSRIIVKRKEVETVMMNLKSVKTMQERPIKSTKTITDFYSAKEIEEKYQISYSRLYVIAKENNIPSATLSGKRLFSMEHIDRYFRKLGYKKAEEITEWYTIEQIQKIYKMTVKAVHSFTSRYKIPKKKEKTGNTTLYSKKHVDEIKNARIGEDGYITVPEACALFNVDRDTIYNRCKWYNIPKKTKGKNVIISIEGLRKVFGTGNIAINNVNEPAIAAHE